MDLLSEEMVRYKQKTKNKKCLIYKLTRAAKCTSTINKALTIFTFNLLVTEHWILQLVFFFNGFVYSLLPSERK